MAQTVSAVYVGFKQYFNFMHKIYMYVYIYIYNYNQGNIIPFVTKNFSNYSNKNIATYISNS